MLLMLLKELIIEQRNIVRKTLKNYLPFFWFN